MMSSSACCQKYVQSGCSALQQPCSQACEESARQAYRVEVVPGGRQRPGLALQLVLQVPDALLLGRVPLLHLLQLPVLRLQRRLRT